MKKDKIAVVVFCATKTNWLGHTAYSLAEIGGKSLLEILLQQLRNPVFSSFVLFDNEEDREQVVKISNSCGAEAFFVSQDQPEAESIRAVVPEHFSGFLRLRSENPVLGVELLPQLMGLLTEAGDKPFFGYSFGFPTGINLEFFNRELLHYALKSGTKERLRAFADKAESHIDCYRLMPDCSELAHPEIRWTAGTAGDFSRLRDFLVLNSPESGLTELLAAWNNRHLQVPDAPKLLNVEPTNHCNLKCIMCPRDKMTRAQGRMSLELFQQILHQASVQGVEQIVLNGYGEPFLHPEIFTMLKLLRNSGVQGRMYTNAQLLKPEYIEKLSAFPPHHLTISLDGFSQKTYEKIRRNGQYERVIANLEDLLQSRKSWAQTMKITLQQIQMPETKSESEGFKDFWQGRVDEISLPAMHNWGGHFADTERSLLQSRVRFPCKELWRTMMIFWDGRVSICCAAFDDDLIVGDLQKESLDEIWQGDKYRELRRLHAENRAGEIALCRHCDMWKYYG